MKLNLAQNINFKTNHYDIYDINPSANPNENFLNHTTQFFRYFGEDEFITNLLRNKKHPLNIVSAGCSYGEEVYSYALALENLAQKPNIVGIDASKTVIEEAKKGIYMLDNRERELLEENCTLYPRRQPTLYSRELKRRFSENFESTNPKFHEYKKKDNTFENCSFIQGNIIDLTSYFKESSQDLILCRMVLYHLTQEERIEFFKQAYKVLKPEGMLCIEPFGHYNYHQEITSAGFEHPYNNALFIYIKPKKEFDNIKFLKDSILHNKSNFNNI